MALTASLISSLQHGQTYGCPPAHTSLPGARASFILMKTDWQLATIDGWADCYKAGLRGTEHIPAIAEQVRILNCPYSDPKQHLTQSQITSRFMNRLAQKGKKSAITFAAGQAGDAQPGARSTAAQRNAVAAADGASRDASAAPSKAASKRSAGPGGGASAAKRAKPDAQTAEGEPGAKRGQAKGRGRGRGGGGRGRGVRNARGRQAAAADSGSDGDYVPGQGDEDLPDDRVGESGAAQGKGGRSSRLRGAGIADPSPTGEDSAGGANNSVGCAHGSNGMDMLAAIHGAALEAACVGADRDARVGAADLSADDASAAGSQEPDEAAHREMLHLLVQQVHNYEEQLKMAQSAVFTAAADAFLHPPIGEQGMEGSDGLPTGPVADLCCPDEFEGEE